MYRYHIYIYVYTHVYLYIYLYTCIHIYIYIYIYITCITLSNISWALRVCVCVCVCVLLLRLGPAFNIHKFISYGRDFIFYSPRIRPRSWAPVLLFVTLCSHYTPLLRLQRFPHSSQKSLCVCVCPSTYVCSSQGGAVGGGCSGWGKYRITN